MWKNEACITKQTQFQLQMFIQIPSNMDKEIFSVLLKNLVQYPLKTLTFNLFKRVHE